VSPSRALLALLIPATLATPYGAFAGVVDGADISTTRDEFSAVVFEIADAWVTDAARGDAWKARVRSEHYSRGRIGDVTDAIFAALAEQGITEQHPLWESWLASVTANFWAQSRFRVRRTSEHNYADGERLDCTRGFDPRCDYGPLQLNGQQVRGLWRDVYGRRFEPRHDAKALRETRVIVSLSVAFLVRQKDGRHAFSASRSPNPLACDQVLRRRGALRKARCGSRLGYLRELVGVSRERDVKRSRKTCRKGGCDRGCHCEIMRRATGGVAGQPTTGVATAPGGSTVTAWWALRHYWPRLQARKAARVGRSSTTARDPE